MREDVLRLEVTVHDVLAVCVVERTCLELDSIRADAPASSRDADDVCVDRALMHHLSRALLCLAAAAHAAAAQRATPFDVTEATVTQLQEARAERRTSSVQIIGEIALPKRSGGWKSAMRARASPRWR